MEDFDILISEIKKNGRDKVEKSIFDEYAKECTNKKELHHCRQMAQTLARMAVVLIQAKAGDSKKNCAIEAKMGDKLLNSWLEKAENAIQEVDSEDSDYFYYNEHEDYLFIEFYFKFNKDKNYKNKKREENIDNQANDIKDSEGNVIMRGNWKASAYMLEKKNKEEYQEEKEESQSNQSSQNGVLVINQPILGDNLTQTEQEIALENLASKSQSLTGIEIKKDSDKI